MMHCRKMSGVVAGLRRVWNRNATTVMTVVSVTGYLACILGLNYMAYDHIMEHLYGADSLVSKLVLYVSWFMSVEMMVNWIFLCTVKSNFRNTEETNGIRLKHEEVNPAFSSKGMDYEKLTESSSSGLVTGNWSVITHHYEGRVERTAYPYWSWKPCVVCSFHKPPRCHHCPICKLCVLKRDHHCFFAMQCVGLRNQRFFIVFNFWAVCLTCFATPQIYYYFFTTVWKTISIVEVFLPWTLISYLLGWSYFYTLALMYQLWALVFFILLSASFLSEQWLCINTGKTSHELESPKTTIETVHKTRAEMFATVFGRKYQPVNIFVPLHWLYEPTDDGMSWSSIKME